MTQSVARGPIADGLGDDLITEGATCGTAGPLSNSNGAGLGLGLVPARV